MNKGNININENDVELTAKEKKKQERYMNTMITRKEALAIANNAADKAAKMAVQRVSNMFTESIQTGLVQTMAVIELLKDKRLIESDLEFEEYLKVVAEKIEEYEIDEKGDTVDGEKEQK